MLLDRATAEANARRFVERVATAHVVWGLKGVAGWAVCASHDTDGAQVMPFWSDRAYAARAALEEWASYEPTAIPLDLFLRDWLPGMREDGCLVGPNWDAHNCGLEVEAAAIAQQFQSDDEVSPGRRRTRG